MVNVWFKPKPGNHLTLPADLIWIVWFIPLRHRRQGPGTKRSPHDQGGRSFVSTFRTLIRKSTTLSCGSLAASSDTCHSSAFQLSVLGGCVIHFRRLLLRHWCLRLPTLASLPMTTMKIKGMRGRKKIENRLTSRKSSCASLNHTKCHKKNPAISKCNASLLCFDLNVPNWGDWLVEQCCQLMAN